MSSPGDPFDPSLPADFSSRTDGPDPDFIPAPDFCTPQEYRSAWGGLSAEAKVTARAMVERPGREEYLAALNA
jgi:hypothetical protein